MSMKDWEKDVKELTILGKELFEKTSNLINKIAKELQKDAMDRLNQLKDDFDKTMKIVFKAEEKVTAPKTI